MYCNVHVVLGDKTSFAIILARKRKLIALLKLRSCCHVAVCALCIFLTVSWVSCGQCDSGRANDKSHDLREESTHTDVQHLSRKTRFLF